MAPASGWFLFRDQLSDAIRRRLPSGPDGAEDLHGAILGGDRLGVFGPCGGTGDAAVELSLAAGNRVLAQHANALGGVGESAILDWRPDCSVVGPIPLFALQGGDVVDERIGCECGSNSGSGHLHERKLLCVDACIGVQHLQELLFKAATQGGGGAGFEGFEFVIGFHTEGFCAGDGGIPLRYSAWQERQPPAAVRLVVSWVPRVSR